VAQRSEFEDGEMKECTLGDGKVLVIREGEKFYATGTKCTHYKAPLKNGAFHDGRIRCPWHGACFNAQTGDIEDYPGLDSIPTFPVHLDGENIVVRAAPELIKNSSVPRAMVKCQSDDARVFVIVGAGAAGATAAETLRAEGYTGRLVLINKEKNPPYDRPKLSKSMSIAVEKIYLRTPEFYAKFDIELLLGTNVTQLDAEEKVITLSDNTKIKYDAALLAPGADPQRLPFIPGYNASNVYVLRTAEDAATIYNVVEGKNVIIVGSSFIGMETASCLATRAKAVTVIGMERVPFERVLGLEIGTILGELHEKNGIKMVMGAICEEFLLVDGKVNSIRLKTSGVIISDVDVVIIGAGVVPATSFIKASDKLKLAQDKSVEVDTYLRTGAEGLYAAGDIARFPFPMLPGKTVRIEHWGMAQIHGKIAAQNMLQGDQPTHKVTNIPFFWTTQYGKSLRYCGHALSYEEVVIDEGEKSVVTNPQFLAYYIHEGKVLAACSMNRDPVVAQVSELMNAGIPITVEEIKAAAATKSTDALILRKLREKK